MSSSSFETDLFDEIGVSNQMIYLKTLTDKMEKQYLKQTTLQNAKETFFTEMVAIIVQNNKTKGGVTVEHIGNYLRQYAMKLSMNIFKCLEMFHQPCMAKDGERLKNQISTVLIHDLDQVDLLTEMELFQLTRNCLASFEQNGIAFCLGDLYTRCQFHSMRGLAPNHDFMCIKFDSSKEGIELYKRILGVVVSMLDAFLEDLK